MKTKLLRQLRREAYKRYGICYFHDYEGKPTYNIGRRGMLTAGYADGLCSTHDLPLAILYLDSMRRRSILEYISEKKRARDYDSHSKYITAL